jgi:hypothetical protein
MIKKEVTRKIPETTCTNSPYCTVEKQSNESKIQNSREKKEFIVRRTLYLKGKEKGRGSTFIER